MTSRSSTVTTRAQGAACPTQSTQSAVRAGRRCRRPVEGRLRAVPRRTAVRVPTATPRRGRRLHLTARGRLLVMVTIALLLLGAFALGRSASSEASVEAVAPVALTQHTVVQGDTLWSVARELASRRDPRDVVEQIRRLNHLATPSLQAGQQLLLPAVR